MKNVEQRTKGKLNRVVVILEGEIKNVVYNCAAKLKILHS